MILAYMVNYEDIFYPFYANILVKNARVVSERSLGVNNLDNGRPKGLPTGGVV
jgi:hypothetical protein